MFFGELKMKIENVSRETWGRETLGMRIENKNKN